MLGAKENFYLIPLYHTRSELILCETLWEMFDRFYFGKDERDRIRQQFYDIERFIRQEYEKNAKKCDKLNQELINSEKADEYKQLGPFAARKQILKVPKLGPKAFDQCAGFLRVPESGDALDNTGVHPESCRAAEKLLALTGHTLADIGKLAELEGQVKRAGAEKLAEACGVGVPTLLDIVRELQKPGRDPRDELPPPILRTDVLELKDLRPGMTLTGTVRNVIDFGVFVDIGVHQDGLVHISQISDRFLKHPSEAVSVGDIVKVVVLEVDEKKKRISLSMKQA